MHNPFNLENKVIIITGASSGIGSQCAIDCSKMGAKVVLVARNEERLQQTLSQMEGEGHIIKPFELNNLEGIKELVSSIVAEVGKVDGLIHAAGIEKTLPLKNLKVTDYEEVMKVNTLSAFELIHYLSSKKFTNDNAHFVLISSITSVVGRVGVSAYAASKGALVSAVKTMSLELAKRGITINCISPGTILTPMIKSFLESLTPEQYEARTGGFPLGLGECTDISNACIYLLSDASRWVTGQNIVIDGGYTSN